MTADTTDRAARIEGLDHMQLAMPAGGEERARAFFGELLGLREVPKPAALAARGGVWFACGAQQVNLGVEADFRPQRKGHPGLRVRGLEALRTRLTQAGVATEPDDLLPGYARFYTADPFGNLLELLEPLESAAPDPTPDGDAATAIKARARATFGPAAEAYVTSPGHASGDDLARLVELAAPAATDCALDLATGGGHVALALAPLVARVVASDLTPRMLATARDFIQGRGVRNVEYVVADAERLPFLDASFDLVTVRIAPHHYADVPAALREVARVLAPGGRFILIDNIAPEDPRLDALANAWERQRDPSHVREYTVSEWRAMLAAAGLRITDLETGRKSHDFAPWVERVRMPADARAALEAEMLAAPDEARTYFAIEAREGQVLRWTSDYVVLRATA